MAVHVGDQAPDFELPDSEGGTTRLSDFRGRKNVLLVFYPLAFSPVCTTEFCALRDVNTDIADDDTEVIGISVDSRHALREWKKAEGYRNVFVSDLWPHGAVAKAYGTFNEERGTAFRGTFLIDKHGILRWGAVPESNDARDQSAWRAAIAALES